MDKMAAGMNGKCCCVISQMPLRDFFVLAAAFGWVTCDSLSEVDAEFTAEVGEGTGLDVLVLRTVAELEEGGAA